MELRYFSPSEFSEDISHASPALLNNLDDLRSWYGEPIYPSPVAGALARFEVADQDSQHYAGEGSLSRAIDWFPAGDPKRAWLLAVSHRAFGGVGIYFDTKYDGRPWTMIHTDLRKRDPKLLWYRDKGTYHYFQYDEDALQHFLDMLSKR
jgi:hypothetical protein